MSVIVLASFTAQVNEAEGAFGVFGSGTVEQQVAGSPLEDFNAATTLVASGTGAGPGGAGVTPTDGGTSATTAAGSRIRWTGSRIVWIDSDLHPTATTGEISLDEDLTPGRQTTFRFQTVGHLWAMPTPQEFDQSQPDPGDPAPPAPPPPPAPGDPDTSPRAWGNKPVQAYLSLGQSPRSMVETKVFQGVSLQKSNKGDTAILGEITCVDDSIRYADVPLCYELQPFAGKRRGEITREMAISVGVPLADIDVPIGNVVTKPILLANGSLLTFLNDFWRGENGWAHFDENGKLVVEIIDLKDAPDWTLDAELGDYDLDSFEEIPPTRPPSRYYVKATVPVEGGGTGGVGDGTESTTEEQSSSYNPKCVKVRPSGLPSNLQANGQYCVNAADAVMVTGRTVTTTTKVGGRITQKVVERWAWYNPVAYDPNFNTAPPGTSYDGAYGDHTFHRDEAESFMIVSTETTTFSYDVNGTLLREILTTQGWYAPHRAGNYAGDRVTLTNGNGAYVFPCSTSRIQPVETYQVTGRNEKLNVFDATGVLVRASEKTYAWYSAPAASDVYLDDATHAVTPPPPSPYQSPCPGGYSSTPGSSDGGGGGVVPTDPPSFQPTIVGPLAGVYIPNSFAFDASALGIPTGIVDSTDYPTLTFVETLSPGAWEFNAASGKYDWVSSGSSYEQTTGPLPAGWQFGSPPDLEQQVTGGPNNSGGVPVSPYCSVVFAVTDNNGVKYQSEPLFFDSRPARTNFGDPQYNFP